MRLASFLFLTLFFLCSSSIFSQSKKDKQAYKIFDKQGKEVSYSKMLKVLQKSEVILFGELHNNPIAHWLELSLLKALDSNKVIAGAEMFKSSDQLKVTDYLQGKLSDKEFSEQAELWNNFITDYKPLLDYSAKTGIPFVASNCDRKYARLVAKKGLSSLDSLSAEEKKSIAPLPLQVDMSLPGYKNFLEMGGHSHLGPMNGEYMAQAQALKDATMAHFIVSNYKADFTFLHFNGSYHSDNFEGIGWYLKKYKSDLKVMTVATVEQKEMNHLGKASIGIADFIITIPEDMTKTY